MLNYEFPPIGGGGGTSSKGLSLELVKQGHEVDIVTMAYRGLPREEVIEGVRIIRTPAIRRRPNRCTTLEMASFIIGAARPLLELTKQKTYDVVHCHFLIPTGLLACLLKWRRGLPFIITAHGSDVPGHNRSRFILAHKFTRPILRKILKEASSVTAPSNFLKSLIEKNIGPFGVTAIPNGVSENFFNPSPEKNIILMTGRLERFKGFQYVLKALEGIECSLEVHIIGGGPMMGELTSLAEQINIPVTFHGWLDHNCHEFKTLYERALIFCLPSEHESSGIAALEGMAAGAAVMASNTGGCPEVVGDCGALVEPGNIGQMREVLLKWLNDRDSAKALGAKARQRFSDKFSYPLVAAQYVNLYEKAVGKEAQLAR